jgi:hypothetical protein
MSKWMFEMLPAGAFCPRPDGRMALHGGKGGSSAPPPDPRLIEAQIRSMGFQDDAIRQIMGNAADLAPLQKEQLQFGLSSARTAYGQSQDDRGFMLNRRDKLSGLQDTLTADATSFNSADRADQLAGQATADVNQGFSNARAQSGRAMARMGINPGSGRALAMDNQTAITQAAALAGASTNARTSARMEGRALTDRATNALAGYPAMGMAATGAGAGYGSSGISIANTGLAGLNSGAMGAGGMAGQMGSNAANMYGVMGNYKSAQDKIAADSDPFASILGAGATLGAAYIGKSDRRLKKEIVCVGKDGGTGLNLYEFEYIGGTGTRYRGVMADEVVQVRPDAVSIGEDGFARVNYTALGIDMVELGVELEGEPA